MTPSQVASVLGLDETNVGVTLVPFDESIAREPEPMVRPRRDVAQAPVRRVRRQHGR